MSKCHTFDERRDIVIPGDDEKTLSYAIDHFIQLANEAIDTHGFFSVALSGGSTPKAIFSGLANQKNKNKMNWEKVLLFWSDERYVPHYHPDSNYLMAMDAGLKSLHIPPKHIFPVPVNGNWEADAQLYEKTIIEKIPSKKFDLVMLGMGDDGHTASLFPMTHGLYSNKQLVIANFIPQKDCWRITFTYECINNASHTAIYVMGKSKASMVEKVFTSPFNIDLLPIQGIGTEQNRALWILDTNAGSKISKLLNTNA